MSHASHAPPLRRAGAGQAARARQVAARATSATRPAATSRGLRRRHGHRRPGLPAGRARCWWSPTTTCSPRGLRRPRRRRDPRRDTDDLNGTLVQAAAELHRRGPELRLAALCADLPALRAGRAGRRPGAPAPGDAMSFVADADGVGTTAVVAAGLETFAPRFGPGSRQRAPRRRGARDRPGRRTHPAPGRGRPATTSPTRCGSGVGPRTSLVDGRLGLGSRACRPRCSAYDAATRTRRGAARRRRRAAVRRRGPGRQPACGCCVPASGCGIETDRRAADRVVERCRSSRWPDPRGPDDRRLTALAGRRLTPAGAGFVAGPRVVLTALFVGRGLLGGLLRRASSWPWSSWRAPSSPPSSWRGPSSPSSSWRRAFLAAVFLARGLLGRRLLGSRLGGRGLLRRASSWPCVFVASPSSPPPSWPELPPSPPFVAGGERQLRQLLRADTTAFRSAPGAELRDRGLLGLDALAGARVAHPAGVPDPLLEGAEARDGDLLALGDLAGDRVEHRLERVLQPACGCPRSAPRGCRSADSCSLASLP